MDTQLLELFKIHKTFDNFITLNDDPIVTVLKSYSNQFIHLTGVKDTGKTHLLEAWVNQKKPNSIYIDANFLFSDFANIIDKFLYIAIDNIDTLDHNQQTIIFNLFNTIKLNNKKNMLLTSSSNVIDKLPSFRDDVRTRILSGLNINLKALDDDEILKNITVFIKKEAINIGDHELNYLINHCKRNIGSLINTINQIAEISLLKNRHITIPLIKEVVGSDSFDL